MNNTDIRLVSCLWEMTLKCNLNCIHCGSVAGTPKTEELTLTESFRIADEIIALGCKEITLIGGEVFLYHGWEKIARHLSDHNIQVNIITNGLILGEREINQVKYANLANVGISVDGTEEVHNQIRGNKHSFKNIIRSFELLNEAGICTGAVTSLMELNYPDLESLYSLLVDNHVNLWQIQLVNPMGNMAGKKEMILEEKHIPDLIGFIREKNWERKIKVVAADNVGYFFDDSELYIRGSSSPLCYYSGCKAGINTVFIDSTGNVKGCGALYDDKFIEGNVRQDSLADIWFDESRFGYNRRFDVSLLSGKCNGCSVGSICRGGCRASNYFNTGSLYKNIYCPRENV